MLTYNSEHGRDLVRIVGTVNIVMDYEKQEGELSTLVVKGSGLSFLGGIGCLKSVPMKVRWNLNLRD